MKHLASYIEINKMSYSFLRSVPYLLTNNVSSLFRGGRVSVNQVLLGIYNID